MFLFHQCPSDDKHLVHHRRLFLQYIESEKHRAGREHLRDLPGYCGYLLGIDLGSGRLG